MKTNKFIVPVVTSLVALTAWTYFVKPKLDEIL